MDEHDEAFEAIPWDRFTPQRPGFDPRMAAAVVVVAVVIGVTAFALRRTVPPPVTTTPVAVEAPVDVPVAPPTTTTVPQSPVDPGDGLWAGASAAGPHAPVVARRFTAGLLVGSGLDLLSVHDVGTTDHPAGTAVTVELLGEGPDGTPVRLGLEVVVAADATVVSWEPVQVPAIGVRSLTEGAEPPPEVLDVLVRTAARWGTAGEVTRSGIDGDRWWAEFLVEVPGGGEVPLVVWEG